MRKRILVLSPAPDDNWTVENRQAVKRMVIDQLNDQGVFDIAVVVLPRNVRASLLSEDLAEDPAA